MKAVDVLIQARALLSDRSRWTKDAVHRVKNGSDCYCATGALAVAGGVMRTSGEASPGCYVGICGDVYAKTSNDYLEPDEAPQGLLRLIEGAYGADLKATHVARKYLDAASTQLHADSIVQVNDLIGYNATMAAFDLAIKNAKRRHIGGPSH